MKTFFLLTFNFFLLPRGFAAEFEVIDKFLVDGTTTLKSTVTIVSQSSQTYILGLQKPSGEFAVQVATTGNMAVGTSAVSGARLAVISSTEMAYLITAGTSTAYSFVVSTTGNVGIGTTGPGALLQVGGGTLTVTAAGNVGIGTTSPVASLDVGGAGSIRIPVGTEAQRPANPLAGMMRFNTTTAKMEFYDGTSWLGIGSFYTTGDYMEYPSNASAQTAYVAAPASPTVDNYTKLLLHGDGADASTVFTDSAGDSNTVLMLHFDGANNATTTTDAATNKAVTFNSAAKISTAQSRFGGASYLSGKAADSLTLADSDDWNLGTGDFTMEGWYYFDDVPQIYNYLDFVSQYADANNQWNFLQYHYANNTHYFCLEMVNGGAWVTGWAATLPAGTIVADTWYHYAMVRKGNVFNFYINGVAQDAGQTNSITFPDLAANLTLMRQTAGSTPAAYVDDVRIIKGKALYTANFTPPAVSVSPKDVIGVGNAKISAKTIDGASGGTITYTRGKTIHKFTSNGTFAVTGSGNLEVLVVAGGGGAPASTAGGAGGLLYNSSYAVTSGNMSVTVGAGSDYNAKGNNSVFGTMTAEGGGKGDRPVGGNGGSGGSNGGLGTAGQGHDGSTQTLSGPPYWMSSGGGGAGAAGHDRPSDGVGGAGGDGLEFPQLANVAGNPPGWFAGGEGGKGDTGTPGADGKGNGAENTGGGHAFYGYSGIVIASYNTPPEFGAGSILLDGTGDYLSLADSDDWDFGTGSFTVDFWVRFYTIPAGGVYYNLFGVGGYGAGIIVNYYNHDRLVTYIGTTSIQHPGITFSTNTWYHIAAIRNGNNYSTYINGTQLGTTDITGQDIQTTAGVFIGKNNIGSDTTLDGWIDEFRISKGLARWTSNFTPPAIAYPIPITALQSYTESAVKTQGSYSLKGIAPVTDSLNNTMTKTYTPNLNLTGVKTIKFDLQASRTGSNIKIGIHDTGGTTTETTPDIVTPNIFQTVTWDISGVSDSNKDAIDRIVITIINADADNTFYLDNMYFNISY